MPSTKFKLLNVALQQSVIKSCRIQIEFGLYLVLNLSEW